MTIIPDSIKLLSLAVSTVPYSIENNIVTATISTYTELPAIIELRNTIYAEFENLPAGTPDEVRMIASDNVYMLDKLIYELQGKI